MAGEKIPQAGEPIICTEVEDLLATLPTIGETTDALTQKVTICDLCGRGFLTIFDGADNMPLWWVGENGPQGDICGGAIRTVSRKSALKVADNYEQIGPDAWLRGQRRIKQ